MGGGGGGGGGGVLGSGVPSPGELVEERLVCPPKESWWGRVWCAFPSKAGGGGSGVPSL